jgi:FkbM family methyltransferase
MISKFITILKKEGMITSIITLKNHLILEVHKSLFSSNGLIIKKVHENKMYLDLSYPGISRDLAIYGTREKLEVEILKTELEQGWTVLDIGANIGYYSLLEASLVGDKGKIYALEPEPRNLKLLAKNIELNNYSNIVETYPLAVSDKSGLSKLYLSEFSNLHTMIKSNEDTISEHKSEELRFIEVKTVKVDDFLKDKGSINFIRMDIEGYECEAIDGIVKTLDDAPPPIKLLIEVHPYFYNENNRNFKLRLIKLKELGFKAKYIVSAGVACPPKIIESGYRPLKTIREGRFSRGLYKDVAMEDLINFIHFRPKIVRAVLLVKNGNN